VFLKSLACFAGNHRQSASGAIAAGLVFPGGGLALAAGDVGACLWRGRGRGSLSRRQHRRRSTSLTEQAHASAPRACGCWGQAVESGPGEWPERLGIRKPLMPVQGWPRHRLSRDCGAYVGKLGKGCGAWPGIPRCPSGVWGRLLCETKVKLGRSAINHQGANGDGGACSRAS